jgi:hypothetical protein
MKEWVLAGAVVILMTGAALAGGFIGVISALLMISII